MGELFPLVNREKSVLLGTQACYTTNIGSLTWLCFKWHPSKPLFFFSFATSVSVFYLLWTLHGLSSFQKFSLTIGVPISPLSYLVYPQSRSGLCAGFVTSCVACGRIGSLLIPGERAMLPKLRYFCLIRSILRYSTLPSVSWWLGQVFFSSMH